MFACCLSRTPVGIGYRIRSDGRIRSGARCGFASLKDLYGIWSGGGDAYAVGWGGSLLRSTAGGAWAPQTSGTTNRLFCIWGDKNGHIYAVGEGGTILHGP